MNIKRKHRFYIFAPKVCIALLVNQLEGNQITGQVLNPPPNHEDDILSNYSFETTSPIASKLLQGTKSDSDTEAFDEIEEKSAGWITKNERKRKNKTTRPKRKHADSPTNPSSFKKSDKKTTPKHKL